MFRVATREETSTLPTTGPLWWESYGDRHVMRSQPTRPANLSHVSSNHASQGLLGTNKAWNPAFRFNVSVTTWYKQGLKPGISFHCLCDNLVQTRLGARHFVWLSLWRLGTNKAWDPEFRVIVSATTWYRQGLKPGISFHCLRDYLLQTRPGTRHFISLSPGRLGTIKVWNPTFHFIVSGTTWYKQCPKPDISFHCLWDELVQTMPETRHFISLSPGLLVTNNAWNPAFHFIVRGTTCYKQCLKPGISFHCPRDYLLQTMLETRHFISLSLGLLGTNKAWNPAFHFIVRGTTCYKQWLKPGISFHCLWDYLVQNKAWNPAFHFIVSGTTWCKQGLKPGILFHLQVYRRSSCYRKVFCSSSLVLTTLPEHLLSSFIPWPVTRKCKRRHIRKWMTSLAERSVWWNEKTESNKIFIDFRFMAECFDMRGQWQVIISMAFYHKNQDRVILSIIDFYVTIAVNMTRICIQRGTSYNCTYINWVWPCDVMCVVELAHHWFK